MYDLVLNKGREKYEEPLYDTLSLTITPRGRVGYELAIIILCPTSASGIIVL